ncbi:hypothetical protein GCM10011365_04110 [Marinicella pacifica]|uniref:Uncharacterized protein n=1 Tax=Marinicella pacifica TaxID=1171543 RepID=A0A917FJI8_9GAMM|nr:hypothetical protein [Marinicella pacifica]GGF86264.1 hypothetical protein GCM10011365_04110 [Marinicella pacifica]
MQRLEKEIRKKRAELLAGLNSEQIEFFEAVEELRDILNRFESKFHVTMFPEEYDFMYDDSVDYKARKRGENPMQESYQQKVNERRQKFGLEPLEDNGMVRYDDSIRYTKDKVNRLLTSEDQTLKAEIKELIDVEFNFKRFMEQLKAYDVDQFMADKRKEMAKRFGKENI